MNTVQIPDFNKLWNYSNPEETRSKFQNVYLETRESADLDYLLQLKTQIARTYSLRAEFKDAHSLLDTVKGDLSERTPLARVRYYLERGRTYNSAGDIEKAKALFKEAYEESLEKDFEFYAIDAIHMLAVAEFQLDNKLAWNRKGIDLASQSRDEGVKNWVGVFYNNSGWDLFDNKNYSQALEMFLECEKFYISTDNKERVHVARWSIAKSYRMLKEIDKSLEIQIQLLEEANGNDKSGYVFEELAELYYIKEDSEKYSTYFSKAYQTLSQDVWLRRNEKERLERMKRLSQMTK